MVDEQQIDLVFAFQLLREQQIADFWSSCDYPSPHRWREVMCEWMYAVVDHFIWSREIVEVAMSIFDRFIASTAEHGSTVTKERFLIVGGASFLVAVKLQMSQQELFLKTLVHLGRGKVSAEAIVAVELDILIELQRNLCPPTGLSFVHFFHKRLADFMRQRGSMTWLPSQSRSIFDGAQYLVEVSIIDGFFIKQRPSVVALAALMTAKEDALITLGLHSNDIPNDVLLGWVSPEHASSVMSCKQRLRLGRTPVPQAKL